MYAPVDQKPFTFAAHCDEAFLIAKFEGTETAIKIHAVDQHQIISLLSKLVSRLERGRHHE